MDTDKSLYEASDNELLDELTSRLQDMPGDERIDWAVEVCYTVASYCGIHLEDLGVLEMAKARCIAAIRGITTGS